MKKILLVISLLIINGCSTIQHQFPNAPIPLDQPCPTLTQLNEDTKELSDVLSNVSSNYALYHICQNKVDEWINWYTQQKKIYDSVK